MEYTREDLESYYNFCRGLDHASINVWQCLQADDPWQAYRKNTTYFEKYAEFWMMFDMPFENIPLYINEIGYKVDISYWRGMIARWRLNNGK